MRRHEAEGSGSGAIFDKQGHVLTNYHVVDGARDIEVTLASNKTFPAELVGKDKEHDIAVLRIEAPPKICIRLLSDDPIICASDSAPMFWETPLVGKRP